MGPATDVALIAVTGVLSVVFARHLLHLWRKRLAAVKFRSSFEAAIRQIFEVRQLRKRETPDAPVIGDMLREALPVHAGAIARTASAGLSSKQKSTLFWRLRADRHLTRRFGRFVPESRASPCVSMLTRPLVFARLRQGIPIPRFAIVQTAHPPKHKLDASYSKALTNASPPMRYLCTRQ